jgi:hypothetical protein
MNFRILFFHGLIVLCLLAACRTRQAASNGVSYTKTITSVQRDTIFKVQADSSFYQAWIDCVNGKPMIVNDTVYKSGKYLNSPKVTLNGNKIHVDCIAQEQTLFKTWQQQYIKEHQAEVITLPPVTIAKPLTWWQNTQLLCGRLLLIGIVLYLIYILIKTKIQLK